MPIHGKLSTPNANQKVAIGFIAMGWFTKPLSDAAVSDITNYRVNWARTNIVET